MEISVKPNRLALISFICGVIALLSLGLYYILFGKAYGTATGNINPLLPSIMDLTVPVRNVFSAAAVITGILALVEIKKKEGADKGKLLAWVGILLGAAWFLVRIVVGVVFLLGEILH